MFEIAHTPAGALDVRAGWTTWALEGQAMIADRLKTLDVAAAQAFDPADKKMIDSLVIESFGSFEAANEVVVSVVRQGYFGGWVWFGG